MILCDDGSGDEIEAQYLLSKPGVNPNVYDEVNDKGNIYALKCTAACYFSVWKNFTFECRLQWKYCSCEDSARERS